MAKYGMPYMGSKSKIVEKIIPLFPKAKNFYDLFAGGFSVTHAMVVKRPDYKCFYANEIQSDLAVTFRKAVNGEYNYDVFKPKWISRAEFFKKLDDPYIRTCWSFGNNQKNYLYSKEIEPYKKSMHEAIVFNRFDETAKKVFGHDGFRDGYSVGQRRLFLKNRLNYFRKNGVSDFLKHLLSDEQLERVQQLEQLQKLDLSITSKSYDQVEIKDDSVIYCDPPYKGTADYGNKFDHDKFFDWAHNQKQPVFVSEYNIDDKRFKLVKKIKKKANLQNTTKKTMHVMEKLYTNDAGWRALIHKG